MNKGDLTRAADISTSTVKRLSKNETVTTTVLMKICEALNCDLSDITEMVSDDDIDNDTNSNGRNKR